MTADFLKNNARRKEILEWVISLGLAVALALAVHAWLGEFVSVSGPSMEPTLFTGQKVLVGKPEYYFASPKRGDIVLVRYPNSSANYIKRVIATQGETVSVSDGTVYVGGKTLSEPYVVYPADIDMMELTVPPGTIFVMGDNRANSADSRDSAIGAIPLQQVVGRAYWLVWPFGDWKKLTEYTGKLEP